MTDVSVFGDSVLKGVVLENNKYKVSSKRFTNICEEVLGIKIENKAKFGSTISIGEKSIEKNLQTIQDTNSKYVIMEFGGNDCDYNWKEISISPNGEHKPNSDIKSFTKIYTELINKIKQMNKRPVL